MGKACSKNSAQVADTAGSRRESTSTPATTTQHGPSQKAAAKFGSVGGVEGTGGPHIVTADQHIEPVELVTDASAGEEGGTQKLTTMREDGGKLSITTVEGEQGVAPVAVIRQEKSVIDEGEDGQRVMKSSVCEAIITADLPGLPASVAGVSPEDLEVLRKAHEHVKQQRAEASGPAVVDVADKEGHRADPTSSNHVADNTQKGQSLTVGEKVTKAAAYGYLLYFLKKDGGSLSLLWSKEPLDPDTQEAENNSIILLSFVPAPHKTVSKIKFTAQGGRTDLMNEIETKWEVRSKSDKQKYYQGWVQALKVCNEYEATVTVQEWSAEWPPRVDIKLLSVGPTGNLCVTLRPGRSVNLNAFSYVAVLPTEAKTIFKDGSNPTEKKFVDAVPPAGGACSRLIRRGYGAALDQDVLIKWLEEDGIKIPPEQKGITLGGDRANYERRAVDKPSE